MRVRAGIALTLLLAAPQYASAQRASFEELQTFSQVLNLVRLNYVDSTTYGPLVRAAIEGALGALDPHSRYVRKESQEVLIAARSGEYGTAGIQLEDLLGQVTVLAVGRNGAGDRAGLLPGDRIISVQDTPVIGLTPDDVELLLTGPPGSKRTVVVERNDYRVTTRLELARFVWPAVGTTLLLGPGVGYVRLEEFTDNAARELERAIDGLRREDARSLVLDLRGNPGGVLEQAGRVAELFLPDNETVFRTVGRKVGASGEFRTERNGPFRGMQVVLLVDGGTASAAETVAGALQDHGRAVVVGHRTFGKALVQAPFPLPSGDVLLLTIARVQTPSGRVIQRSYDQLTPAQYRSFAEQLYSGDSIDVPGGVVPDIRLPVRTPMPDWWGAARQRGLDLVAAQRAVLTGESPESWRAPLLQSLQAVIASELGVTQPLSPAVETTLSRHLVAVALSVRASPRSADEYRIRNDPEIARAAALLNSAPPAR